MGNIYSEVGRALNAKSRHDLFGCEQAKKRAVALFDATIDALHKKQSPRSREVLQAKKQFLEVIKENDLHKENAAKLDQYFLAFAVSERLHR